MSRLTELLGNKETPKIEDLSVALKLGAFKLHYKKNLLEAAEIFKRCIKSHPKDFRAYFNLGTILDAPGDMRDYEGAVQLFRQAIRHNASIIESYGCLSGVLLKLNRPEEAVRVCHAGLLVVPTDPPCFYNLQVALRMMGQLQKAIDFTSVALSNCTVASSLPSPPSIATAKGRVEADVNAPVVYVCVKWGEKYGAAYVNALYRSLLRHNVNKDSPPRLVCLTEDPEGVESGVECAHFPPACKSWEAWWLKGAVLSPETWYRPGTKDGHDCSSDNGEQSFQSTSRGHNEQNRGMWVIYVDLDSVVCGPLIPRALLSRKKSDDESEESGTKRTIAYSHTLYTLSAAMFDNEQRVEGVNSSIMLWYVPTKPEPGRASLSCFSFSSLFRYLQKHYASLRGAIFKFDHYIEMSLLDRSPSREGVLQCELVGDGCVVDFNRFVKGTGGNCDCIDLSLLSLDELRKTCDVSVVCFPLEPKPLAVRGEYSWVAEYFQEKGVE